MVAAGQDVHLVHTLVLLLVRPGSRGHLLHDVGPATRLKSGSELQCNVYCADCPLGSFKRFLIV